MYNMDLHGGEPYWRLKSGLIATYPPIAQDETCDVLVVGAGITGALVGHALSKIGLDVVMLDRRDIASGSTAASTALLQYEIDVPLVELEKLIGVEKGRHAYRLGVDAIRTLREYGEEVGVEVAAGRSVYVTGDAGDEEFMRNEAAARVMAGLDARVIDAETLRERWKITGACAIESAVGASVDPYVFAHRLLKTIADRGGRIFDRSSVLKLTEDGTGVTAITEHGPLVRARWVVLACGYETREFITEDVVSLHSTYALVTEPIAGGLPWPKRTLVWEHASAYLYARGTDDGRLVVGGEDEPFKNATLRDALIESKANAIMRRLERFIPEVRAEIGYAWAGTFGRTEDGLGYIGAPKEHPRILCALGFGGNGITFSAVAAKLVPAMIETWDRGMDLRGETRTVAELFRFGR
jgi:glycine/D-amino acid oxidase-like deaminating enzyme